MYVNITLYCVILYIIAARLSYILEIKKKNYIYIYYMYKAIKIYT